MQYNFQEIGDIGLEIEFVGVKRDTHTFADKLNKKNKGFKIVHDVSAETPEISLGGIPIQFEVNGKTNKFFSIMRNKRFETFGGELNSPILPANDFKEHVYNVIEFLRDMGETYSTTDKDERGSIHVHINVTRDIRHKHLIRLLELGLATEAIFYKLGGMGKINRGVKNNFIYQRPITMPPCVPYNSKIFPIFDYKDLLNTTGKAEFYLKYGDSINCIEAGNHYVTQRYVGLNFYSIPYRGSLEFRYANKVLTPEWIIAWISLCQSFVEFALTKSKDNSFENEYRKLEDNRDIPEDEFLFIIDKLNLSDDSKITLLDIWRESTIPIFDGLHRFTHLQDCTFYKNPIKYLPAPIVGKVMRSDIVDGRKLGIERQNKLDHIIYTNENNVIPDYDLDDSGVKQKVKLFYDLEYKNANMDFRFGEDLLRINPRHVWRDDIIEHYAIEGLDVLHSTIDDKVTWVEQRMQIHKYIPFVIFELNWWYILETNYDGLQMFIKFENQYKTFRVYWRKVIDNNETSSNELRYNSIFKEYYDSFCYNLSDLTIDCVNNQHDYGFPTEDDLEYLEEPDDNPVDLFIEDLEFDNNPDEQENN